MTERISTKRSALSDSLATTGARVGTADLPRSPSSRRAWYVVIILCLLFAISHLDRYILPLLAVPLASELALSDTQLGLLLGMGFAVLFAVAGLPLAYLLDRHDRIVILVCCVVLWSLSTIASAFADSFLWLFLCRSGVALGEAVLYPAAISLVADLFIEQRRARPLTVISTVSTLMSGGAFFIGALAVTLSRLFIEAGATMSSWRITLIIVGAPGIALAMVILATVKDPRRATPHGTVPTPSPGVLWFLKQNRRFYLPYLFGLGTSAAITLGAVAWVPVILARGFAMDTATAGYLFGIVCLIPAATGAMLWSWLSRRVDGKSRSDGPIIGLLASATVMTVGAVFVSLATSSTVLFLLVAIVLLGGASLVILPSFAVNAVAQGQMHARLMSVNLFATSTIGLMGGPLAIPLLAKNWPGDPYAIGYGLASFSAIAGALAITSFALARPHFKAMVDAGDRACATG